MAKVYDEHGAPVDQAARPSRGFLIGGATLATMILGVLGWISTQLEALKTGAASDREANLKSDVTLTKGFDEKLAKLRDELLEANREQGAKFENLRDEVAEVGDEGASTTQALEGVKGLIELQLNQQKDDLRDLQTELMRQMADMQGRLRGLELARDPKTPPHQD